MRLKGQTDRPQVDQDVPLRPWRLRTARNLCLPHLERARAPDSPGIQGQDQCGLEWTRTEKQENGKRTTPRSTMSWSDWWWQKLFRFRKVKLGTGMRCRSKPSGLRFEGSSKPRYWLNFLRLSSHLQNAGLCFDSRSRQETARAEGASDREPSRCRSRSALNSRQKIMKLPEEYASPMSGCVRTHLQRVLHGTLWLTSTTINMVASHKDGCGHFIFV